MDFLPDSCRSTLHGLLKNSCLTPRCCFFDVLFVTDMKTEWKAAPPPSLLFVRPTTSSSTMHGFESQHCHLVVKATKPHLIHRDDSPTHHPLTIVCSRVCLASPGLNTEHKASHTVKTMPLNTQWMPFNCSVVFLSTPPCCLLSFASSVSSVVSQSVYTHFKRCPLMFKVKTVYFSGCRCGNGLSFHRSGKWYMEVGESENKQLLWRSCVYHSEGEQVSSAPVDIGKRGGLLKRARHYWSHGWRLKPLVPWNDGGARLAYQQIRASAGCVYSVLVTTTRQSWYTLCVHRAST